MELRKAIKELREQVLRESQTVFAARLKLSLRAIAGYEKNRIPETPVLVKMLQLADAGGRNDLGDLFQAAIQRQIGYPLMRYPATESEDFDALTTILRIGGKLNRDTLTQWRKISQPVKDVNRAKDDRARQHMENVQKINQLFSEGKTDQEIMDQFPEEQRETARMIAQMFRGLAALAAKGNAEK